MEKMFEVRMALETLAIEKAARNLTPAALDELRRHLATIDKAARRIDLSMFHQSDVAFHRVIWDLTGNEHLGAALDRIAFVLFAFMLLKQRDTKESYAASVMQHERIVAGLCARDPVEAIRIFQENTEGYWRQYRHLRI